YVRLVRVAGSGQEEDRFIRQNYHPPGHESHHTQVTISSLRGPHGTRQTPASTTCETDRLERSTCRLERDGGWLPRQAARSGARTLPAFGVATAPTHTYRVVGHSGVQPRRQTQVAKMARGLLAENRSSADRQSVG